jgi:hypothetical protein
VVGALVSETPLVEVVAFEACVVLLSVSLPLPPSVSVPAELPPHPRIAALTNPIEQRPNHVCMPIMQTP